MYSVFYDMYYTLCKFYIFWKTLKPVQIINLCDRAVGLPVKTNNINAKCLAFHI